MYWLVKEVKTSVRSMLDTTALCWCGDDDLESGAEPEFWSRLPGPVTMETETDRATHNTIVFIKNIFVSVVFMSLCSPFIKEFAGKIITCVILFFSCLPNYVVVFLLSVILKSCFKKYNSTSTN